MERSSQKIHPELVSPERLIHLFILIFFFFLKCPDSGTSLWTLKASHYIHFNDDDPVMEQFQNVQIPLLQKTKTIGCCQKGKIPSFFPPPFLTVESNPSHNNQVQGALSHSYPILHQPEAISCPLAHFFGQACQRIRQVGGAGKGKIHSARRIWLKKKKKKKRTTLFNRYCQIAQLHGMTLLELQSFIFLVNIRTL